MFLLCQSFSIAQTKQIFLQSIGSDSKQFDEVFICELGLGDHKPLDTVQIHTFSDSLKNDTQLTTETSDSTQISPPAQDNDINNPKPNKSTGKAYRRKRKIKSKYYWE